MMDDAIASQGHVDDEQFQEPSLDVNPYER